jgi:hypothetical protein
LPSTTTSGAALPGTAGDAPPWPVRVTRSLLGYGAVAGPAYVVVSLAQALTRDGFDLTRHAWSLLANVALTGAMLVAFAVGLRRALAGGRGGRWAPRPIGAFGVGMALPALVFRADPAQGFPPGAAEQPERSWHGALHYPVAGIAFLSLVVACFVLASRYRAEGRGGWAAFSTVAGVVLLVGFAGLSASAGAAWSVGASSSRWWSPSPGSRRWRCTTTAALARRRTAEPPIADLTALARTTEAADTEPPKGSSRCATWCC